ncbi:MAG: Sua5/YciO/YrdC/YwlC family protein [Thaumarchaeota archaeon]|nr:Sua5/YciO/YrdC/YwlC family protein [Nitrososphaerota archaeon]
MVVVPTERWYMLCCDASNVSACERVFQGKRRSTNNPLLLVLRSRSEAYKYFQVNRSAGRLIESLWPGDLALILRWADRKMGLEYQAVGSEKALVGCPGGTLGALAGETGVMIAATSANISGVPSDDNVGPAISVVEVMTFLKKTDTHVSFIIDGGICPQFTHMTIVDCTDQKTQPVVIRKGTVHKRAVELSLGKESDLDSLSSSGDSEAK